MTPGDGGLHLRLAPHHLCDSKVKSAKPQKPQFSPLRDGDAVGPVRVWHADGKKARKANVPEHRWP